MNRDQMIEKRTNARIVAELTPFDVERAFDDMLDESYPEPTVGNCSCSPSRFMREMDPTMHRCGVSEYADSLIGDTITDEIDGEYYDKADADSIRDEVEVDVDEEIEEKEREEQEERDRLEEEEAELEAEKELTDTPA